MFIPFSLYPSYHRVHIHIIYWWNTIVIISIEHQNFHFLYDRYLFFCTIWHHQSTWSTLLYLSNHWMDCHDITLTPPPPPPTTQTSSSSVCRGDEAKVPVPLSAAVSKEVGQVAALRRLDKTHLLFGFWGVRTAPQSVRSGRAVCVHTVFGFKRYGLPPTTPLHFHNNLHSPPEEES